VSPELQISVDAMTADNEPTTNVRLVVAYDGTGFRGLAPNPGVRTVVGELERVIEPLIGVKPDIVMSGRTDAGVHAQGQVLSFEMPDGAVDLERMQRSVNSRLGPEIVVREIVEVPPDFSARFSAIGRRYRYLVVNRPVNDPFLSRTAWWVDSSRHGPLDVDSMNAACPYLIGEHDFSSFCRRPRPRRNTDDSGGVSGGVSDEEVSLVRRIDDARWLDLGDGLLRFDIRGSAFCHQMVRSIVGFLVAVGTGKRLPGELPEVLAARDRSKAENPAPPHGLTLWQVDYEGYRPAHVL